MIDLAILDLNLSPIADNTIFLGDILSDTCYPFIIRNNGNESVYALRGAVMPESGSDGFERLFFRRPIWYVAALHPYYTRLSNDVTVVGDSILSGQVFDLYVIVEGWARSFYYVMTLPVSAAPYYRYSMSSRFEIELESSTLLDAGSAHTNYRAYLRRRVDNAWFSIDFGGFLDISSGSDFSQITRLAAEPTYFGEPIEWTRKKLLAFTTDVQIDPLPDDYSYLAVGDYAPVVAVVTSTGGSASQQFGGYNKRRAILRVTGDSLA